MSSSAASSCTCCPKASTASATTGSSPTAIALRTWPRRESCWTCMLPHVSPSPPTHHPLIRVLAHAAAAACASSKCSPAARRHDIGPRQPRSALTPHDRAPHEHQRLPRFEPLARRRRRSPLAGAMLCPTAEPANPSAPLPFRPSPLPSAAVVGPFESPPRLDLRRHQL